MRVYFRVRCLPVEQALAYACLGSACIQCVCAASVPVVFELCVVRNESVLAVHAPRVCACSASCMWMSKVQFNEESLESALDRRVLPIAKRIPAEKTKKEEKSSVIRKLVEFVEDLPTVRVSHINQRFLDIRYEDLMNAEGPVLRCTHLRVFSDKPNKQCSLFNFETIFPNLENLEFKNCIFSKVCHSRITHLRISGCLQEKFVPEFSLRRVEVLDLSENKLTNFHLGKCKVPKLCVLDLHANEIGHLSDLLENNLHVQVLDCSRNPVRDNPKSKYHDFSFYANQVKIHVAEILLLDGVPLHDVPAPQTPVTTPLLVEFIQRHTKEFAHVINKLNCVNPQISEILKINNTNTFSFPETGFFLDYEPNIFQNGFIDMDTPIFIHTHAPRYPRNEVIIVTFNPGKSCTFKGSLIDTPMTEIHDSGYDSIFINNEQIYAIFDPNLITPEYSVQYSFDR